MDGRRSGQERAVERRQKNLHVNRTSPVLTREEKVQGLMPQLKMTEVRNNVRFAGKDERTETPRTLPWVVSRTRSALFGSPSQDGV